MPLNYNLFNYSPVNFSVEKLSNLVEQNLSAEVESGGGTDGGLSPASLTSVFSSSSHGSSTTARLGSSTTLAGLSVRASIGAQLPADVVRFSTVNDPVPVSIKSQ